MKSLTSFVEPSSSEMPRTVNPWAAYFFCIWISHGISSLQGPHHVAQKFSRTALPLYSESETDLPSTVFRVKEGAGFSRKSGSPWAVGEFASALAAVLPALSELPSGEARNLCSSG